MKTFSDKPADAAPKSTEGWTGSAQPHVDPSKAEAVRAQKPVENKAANDAGTLRPIESIPAPAAKEPAPRTPPAVGEDPTPRATQQPTIAPLGPSVEPAPPAADTRDLPAAETSSSLLRIETARGDRAT